MKSIRKKAKNWCSEHSNKGCTEQCDGCWQLKQAWGCEQHNMEMAYEAGANYVLEEIENVIKADRILGHPFPSLEMRYNQIISVIEQLKK